MAVKDTAVFRTPDDLKKKFAESPCGVYLFCGKEDYLMDRWLEKFEDAVKKDGFFDIDRTKLDFMPGLMRSSAQYAETGKSDPIDEIRSEISVPPLGGMRLCEVYSFDIEKLADKDIKRFIEIAEDIPDGVALILVYSGGSLVPDKKTASKKFFKAISDAVFAVDFAPMGEARMTKWLSGVFAKENVSASADVIRLVIERSENMLEAENNALKLSAYARETRGGTSVPEITKEDVLLLTDENRDAEIYEFTDAVMKCDERSAVALLADLQKKRVEPIVITAALARTVWNMSVVAFSTSGEEMLKAAGIAEWQARKMSPYAKGRKRSFFEKASAAVCECDRLMKSTSSDGYALLYGLTHDLTAVLPSSR